MLKITDRDRIFAAVALPVALVAAYVFLVRAPLAERVAGMRDRLEELGPADEIEDMLPALEARRDAARARRDAAEREEASRGAAASGGVALPSRDDSARLRGVVDAFGRIEGLRVLSSERLDGAAAGADGEGGSARARLDELVREAYGIREPARWRFAVSADYPAVVRALDLARRAGVPAVVEGVWTAGTGRRGGGVRLWTIDVRL
jgi:hypothetical protein